MASSVIEGYENVPEVIYVGPGFYNFRGRFKYKGLLNIGIQMSAVLMASGKFIILDCIELTPTIKGALDKLTENGTLIETLILTHPFHLVHFPQFSQAYPHVQYYGTPRHHRKFPHIKWSGDISDKCVRERWMPELELRIPEGMEFVRPVPEKTNHMCGMFVFHEPSRTIHENDTIMVGSNPNIIMIIDGYRHRKMKFHQCITGPGLLPAPGSPYVLRDWLLDIIKDWDFDNVVAGHMGVLIGGAKVEMQKLIVRSEPLFRKLQKKFEKKGEAFFVANGKYSLNLETDLFDAKNITCECG